MDAFTRFSPLVRQGLRFRSRFEQAKRSVEPVDFAWYPYDCFANLFYLQHLLKSSRLSLAEVVGTDPVLDIGAADGALSFFLESLGYRVKALDYSGSNINRMLGLRKLALHLGSQVDIHDFNLDGHLDLSGKHGLALFLGTLYHLKNPYYALETLAGHSRFCFLSTRVARVSADKRVRLDNIPVAYLLDAAEVNSDTTNYWIFSPPGLMLLAKRTGWIVRASAASGAAESDPTTGADERMFLLLESECSKP